MKPIKPRTETIIVLQGDDDEKVRHLAAEVQRVEKAKPKPAAVRMMTELDPVQEWEAELETARRAHDAFLEEARERGTEVVLTALVRKFWRALIEMHPPRESPSEDLDKFANDKKYGANVDDLQEDLVPLCMTSHVEDTSPVRQRVSIEDELKARLVAARAECGDFLDSLNEGQFGHLAIRAHALNMGRTADPTQRLSSADSRTSNVTSS